VSILDERARTRGRLVKSTADKIFSSLAIGCPQLTVVVIEMQGPEPEDDWVHSFLRSKQVGADGETTIVGLAGEENEIHPYRSCSDILPGYGLGFLPGVTFVSEEEDWTL
jgi:hypothetical protein